MNNNTPKNRSVRAWLLLPVLFVIAVVCATQARAQQSQLVAASKPGQDASAALATLPEAEMILYVNPRRLLTEALPRVMSDKDLQGLRGGLMEMKTHAGIDPSTLDYVVVQVRFKKPAADLSFSLPEFILVTKGNFDGAALLQVIREAAKDKLREESYNSKTLHLITIDDIAKQAEKMPLLKSLSEVAIVQLDGDTFAVGTTSYVKAAVDAAGGKGRINPDLLNSVLRDQTVLFSTAGSPLTAFAKTFALLGTENNPRIPKCEMKLGDYYAAITMDATSFKVRGAMNADNPDTAKIIKSLISLALDSAAGAVMDAKAQSILKGLVITPTETEVLIQADISQQAVADYIREANAPKKTEEASASAPTPEKKPATKRRTRRRAKPKN